MTTGQRIAQKRKERNLSQEALGEQLGVSRQAIYKWESDASLPEIEKLVAMSRLFGISVGELLGVEEPDPAESGFAAPPQPELTEQQIRMVEEITRRYIEAQPKPKRRRWPWILLAGALLVAVLTFSESLSRIDNRVNNLQNTVGGITSDVSNQINGIANRVEQVLKNQNNLTADYGASIVGADLRQNLVTIRVRAVPKTYTEGMQTMFLAESEGQLVEQPGVRGEDGAYTADLAVPLTNSINVSVVFVNGETRQTQLLESFSGYYGDTVPRVSFEDHVLMWEDVNNGLLKLQGKYAYVRNDNYAAKPFVEGMEMPEIQEVKLGLFVDHKLVFWLTPSEKPENYVTNEDHQWYRIPDCVIPLQPGQRIQIAARVTDSLGRSHLQAETSFSITTDGTGQQELSYADYTITSDDTWIY